MQSLLLQLTDIQRQLNQETLCVTGLAAGPHKLTIDGILIGTFSVEDLEKGINLADYQTPMRQQAQRVGWMVRDRDEAHFIHMRMMIRKADTGAQQNKSDVMDAFESSLENAAYEVATPKPHIYSLSLADRTP
jgi:hypothetical protein